MNRQSGILLPIFSLPSPYGIGCFSRCAYDFVDFLAKSGQSCWQILPLGPTGYGDSPYQSFSAFAGNPYFIDLDTLIEEELLTKEECEGADLGGETGTIDYRKQYENRLPLLRTAYLRFCAKPKAEFLAFVEEMSFWLDDYALFMAIKEKHQGKSMEEWESALRDRAGEAVSVCREELADDVGFYQFVQYLFYTQWRQLKGYANGKGIRIVGDIPIYVSRDSADVWANPHLFQLHPDGTPSAVAGCPPDGFSEKGQLWGNPLYAWDVHCRDGFSWWIRRMEHAFTLYDAVRIDHFRGFDEYYTIPGDAEDATVGRWEKGPGMDLFRAIRHALGERDIIAEDLGFLTESVEELLRDTGYPGMKVLQFAFDARDTGSKNAYLPHLYPENCVAYTGTHDNQTLSSWLKTITAEEKAAVRQYLADEYTPLKNLHLPLIALLMRSAASLCIIPLWDYLGLGDAARINTPSTTAGNWQWRASAEMFSEETAALIRRISAIGSRAREIRKPEEEETETEAAEESALSEIG